jgi:hypothetical protein
MRTPVALHAALLNVAVGTSFLSHRPLRRAARVRLSRKRPPPSRVVSEATNAIVRVFRCYFS